MSDKITENRYFASANGYSGFRSYFDTVFSLKDYERVFILKGGPGTGKSTLMKRLAGELSDLSVGIEAYLCSSDTASLDGISIAVGDKKVAVIDGTMPHIKDPKLPGAADEIIDLESSFNKVLLTNKRHILEKHAYSKNRHYKKAYEYLSISGEITRCARAEIKERYKRSDKELIKDLLKNLKEGGGVVTERLLTAFGKKGFEILDTAEKTLKSVRYIVGVYGSEYIFTSHLRSMLDTLGVDYIRIPSVLNDADTFGFIFPAIAEAIIINNSQKPSLLPPIDTSTFLVDTSSKSFEPLEFLWREREAFLWNSADEFKKAADEHFALEEIYSEAVAFSNNDLIIKETAARIREILL